MDRGAWQATVHGVTKSWDMTNQLTHTHSGVWKIAPSLASPPGQTWSRFHVNPQKSWSRIPGAGQEEITGRRAGPSGHQAGLPTWSRAGIITISPCHSATWTAIGSSLLGRKNQGSKKANPYPSSAPSSSYK